MIPLREPEHYQAFAYQYTNVINDKIYLGYRKGNITDGYDGTCKDPQFSIDLANGNLTREIIGYGTHLEMIELEREMLIEVDAAKNPLYYNRTNGGGAMLKNFVRPIADDFEKKIKEHAWPIVTESIDVLDSYETLQPRHDATDPVHVTNMKNRINDKSGDTSGFLPIVVLKNYRGNGDKIFDGNNRRAACSAAKRAINFPTMYVPKKESDKYSQFEIFTIAGRCNPVDPEPELGMDKKSGIKWILTKYEHHDEIDAINNIGSKSDRAELIKRGHASSDITAILNASKKILENQESFAALRDGEVWNNWADKSGKIQKKRESLVNSYREKDNIVIAKSSAGFRFDQLLTEFVEEHNIAIKKAIVVLWHPSPAAKKKWDRDYQPLWEKVIKHCIGDKKVQFAELPLTTQTKPLTANIDE